MDTESEDLGEGRPTPSLGLGWPDHFKLEIDRLFSTNEMEVEGTLRLGSLAFQEVPSLIREVQDIVTDLTLEPWGELPPGFGDQLMGQLQAFNDTLDKTKALSAHVENAQNHRNELLERLNSLTSWFQVEARPKAQRALIDRRIAETQLPTEDVAITDRQREVQALADEIKSIATRNAQLNKELDSRRDLVSRERQEAGSSAGGELSAEYAARAADQARLAKNWLIALISMTVAAGVLAIATFIVLQNTGSDKSPDFAELGLGLFILGLLAFGIRVCAQNYRVNRHLEASALGKAAVLSTFRRLFSSVEEDDVRTAVALALAQAVFTAEETGLVDSSGDQVTLIERAVSARLPSS